MQLDFYQLSRDPVLRVIPLLAAKIQQANKRVLIMDSDAANLQELSDSLWAYQAGDNKPKFLANGMAQEAGAARQPILLSQNFDPQNGAEMAIMADGVWREEAAMMERAMLMFAESQTQDARGLWRDMASRDNVEPRIFKQDHNGAWRQGGQ